MFKFAAELKNLLNFDKIHFFAAVKLKNKKICLIFQQKLKLSLLISLE